MINPSVIQRRLDVASRQAKKLASALRISLTSAKNALARGAYRCKDWEDLAARLRQPSPEEHLVRLAELPSSPESLSYFGEFRVEIARSLAQQHLLNANLLGLIDIVQEVFAVAAEHASLQDVLPALSTSRWRSANLGPDPEAVLQAEAVVGGIAMRLIATRVYLPEYYDMGAELQPKYAVPHGDIVKIMWSDPQAWWQAALDYSQDVDAEELFLPETRLTESMERHRQFFERCLVGLGLSRFYGSGDERIIPMMLYGSCYLVYGHPMAPKAATYVPVNDAVPPADEHCTSYRVVLVDDTPLILEWIRFDPVMATHVGEEVNYFEQLRRGVLSQGPLLVTDAVGGVPGLLNIQPADTFYVRHALKVEFTHEPKDLALVLKTDAEEATLQVLDFVANRKLTSVTSSYGTNFVVEIVFRPDSEQWPPSLSLTISSQGRWSSENLFLSPKITVSGSEWRAVIEVSPRLLKIVDIVGRKEVERAIKEGQVLRMPADFLSLVNDSPARSGHLPSTPAELLSREPIPFDAILEFRTVRYLRDNF